MDQLKKIYKEMPVTYYEDKKFPGTYEEYVEQVKQSKTIYVSKLGINIYEEQIWALFSTCGEIKRVIFGINKITKFKCGFCFVEFYDREAADRSLHYNNMVFNGQKLIIDKDIGFSEGRQYGRGLFGNQKDNDNFKMHKRRQYRQSKF